MLFLNPPDRNAKLTGADLWGNVRALEEAFVVADPRSRPTLAKELVAELKTAADIRSDPWKHLPAGLRRAQPGGPRLYTSPVGSTYAFGKRAGKTSEGKGRTVKRRRRRKLAGAALAAHQRKRSGRKSSRKRRRKSSGARRSAAGYTVGSKPIRRRKLNPRRKRRRTTRRRAVGAARRNKGGSVARRKRRRASKRRRHAVARRNPRRHIARRRGRRSGRRLHRNPSLSVKGLTGQAVQGIKDATAVLAGEAGTNIVANLIPVAKTGITGIGVRLASALAVGFAAHKALGPGYARFVVAGGFAAVLRPTLKGLGIPLISSNLGGFAAYPLAGISGSEDAYAAISSSGGTGQVPGATDSGLGYADMGFGDDGMGAYPMN